MARINLLNRKLVKKKIKVKLDFVDVYSVARTVNGERYYLHDIDIDENCLMWTSDRSEAIEFYTDHSIQTFIRVHLGSRKGIYVVARKAQIDTVTLIE